MSKGVANKERIVEAARELFYRQGYSSTSFTEIAQTARIPRGNFYYYFKTKEDILVEVIHSRLVVLQDQFRTWDRNLSSPRERLLQFIALPLQDEHNIVHYGCPLGTLNTEMGKLHNGPRSKAVVLFDEVIEWLCSQFEALGGVDEPRMLAMHLLGRLQGAVILCNALRDTSYLHYELDQLNIWVKSLSLDGS
ncbi:MAG: TetR/AcrR family transcriptional regulator [Gammaproteobacteria bacterium]|nr:TetR/AcrR family transcriptional regulator [Gammaproteobacteria bacterium]